MTHYPVLTIGAGAAAAALFLTLAGRRLVRARLRWRRLVGTVRVGTVRVGTVRVGTVRVGGGPVRPRAHAIAPAVLLDHRLARPVGIVLGFGVGLLLDGPVAGAVLGVYAGLALVLVRRALTGRRHTRARRRCVDAVAALAAQLRAGVAVSAALADARAVLDGPEVVGAAALAVAGRVGAAITLAESTGAPLAEVLERLDTHLRAVDRAHDTAGAEAAGAQASALMLAAMPVAGVGLGYVIGIDPLTVLFHTPIGIGCVVLAVALQLAGVAWSLRLARVEVAT